MCINTRMLYAGYIVSILLYSVHPIILLTRTATSDVTIMHTTTTHATIVSALAI